MSTELNTAPFTIRPAKMKTTPGVLCGEMKSICDASTVSQKQGPIFIEVIYMSWSLCHHSSVMDSSVVSGWIFSFWALCSQGTSYLGHRREETAV